MGLAPYVMGRAVGIVAPGATSAAAAAVAAASALAAWCFPPPPSPPPGSTPWRNPCPLPKEHRSTRPGGAGARAAAPRPYTPPAHLQLLEGGLLHLGDV